MVESGGLTTCAQRVKGYLHCNIALKRLIDAGPQVTSVAPCASLDQEFMRALQLSLALRWHIF